MSIFSKKSEPAIEEVSIAGKIQRIGSWHGFDVNMVAAVVEGHSPIVFVVPSELEAFIACSQTGDVVELKLGGPIVFGYWTLLDATNPSLGSPSDFKASIKLPRTRTE